jgi:hypothetical protein
VEVSAIVSKEDIVIGDLTERLAPAKAVVAELKDGEESFGVFGSEEAEMEEDREIALGF